MKIDAEDFLKWLYSDVFRTLSPIASIAVNNMRDKITSKVFEMTSEIKD